MGVLSFRIGINEKDNQQAMGTNYKTPHRSVVGETMVSGSSYAHESSEEGVKVCVASYARRVFLSLNLALDP
jgi:hypothetical protein